MGQGQGQGSRVQGCNVHLCVIPSISASVIVPLSGPTQGGQGLPVLLAYPPLPLGPTQGGQGLPVLLTCSSCVSRASPRLTSTRRVKGWG